MNQKQKLLTLCFAFVLFCTLLSFPAAMAVTEIPSSDLESRTWSYTEIRNAFPYDEIEKNPENRGFRQDPIEYRVRLLQYSLHDQNRYFTFFANGDLTHGEFDIINIPRGHTAFFGTDAQTFFSIVSMFGGAPFVRERLEQLPIILNPQNDRVIMLEEIEIVIVLNDESEVILSPANDLISPLNIASTTSSVRTFMQGVERLVPVNQLPSDTLPDIGHMPPITWGVEESVAALVVGWGCPLHAPIYNITSGVSGEVLGWLNFFFPIAELGSILFVWVIAIGAYYVGSVVLRWVRAVS